MTPSRKARGFTLIEALISLAILAIGAAGACLGLIAVSRDLADGQYRQYKTSLLDARWQRMLGQNKSSLTSSAVNLGGTVDPRTLALGATPWVPDPAPSVVGDLATGAFFTVTPDGVITRFVPSGTGVNCNDSSIPAGTFCREVAVVNGLPQADAGTITGTTPITIWTRVARKGEPLSRAVTRAEVFIQ